MNADEIEAAADSLARLAHMVGVVDIERRDQYVDAMRAETSPPAPVPWVVSPAAVNAWLAGEAVH